MPTHQPAADYSFSTAQLTSPNLAKVGFEGRVADGAAVPSGAWHRGCEQRMRRRLCRTRRRARSAADSVYRELRYQSRLPHCCCCSERPSAPPLSSCASGPRDAPYKSTGDMEDRCRGVMERNWQE